MTLNARNKGKAGEYEAIKLLETWANEIGQPLELERNLEQVRASGSDINGVVGLEIEVKRVETPAINAWWAQVCKAAEKTGNKPFLMHRRNRKPWSFRTRAFVWPYGGPGIVLDVDLTQEQAEIWFKEYLKYHG